jgi:hypothetical protein
MTKRKARTPIETQLDKEVKVMDNAKKMSKKLSVYAS